MKIQFKSLKGDLFAHDLDPAQTVAQAKSAIQATHDVEIDKMIHQGKVLEDDQTIGHYNMKESDRVILMMKKKAPAAAPTAPPKAETTQVSAPAPTPANPVSQQAPAPQSQAQTDSSVPVQAPGGMLVGAELQASVNQMCEMGFTRDQVMQAMRAAFNNPERAMQYLLDGIPAEFAQAAAQQAATPSTPTQALDAGAQAPPQGFAGMGQIAQLLQQNPAALQPILQELARTRPDLMAQVAQNPEAFLNLLNQAGQGEDDDEDEQGLPPGMVQVQLTPEEREAVNRLMDLGFEEQAALQAFLLCDRNEALAANFLFDNQFS